MKYSFSLLLLFFLGVLAETGLAQRTAQASMTVSATVVSAPTIAFFHSESSAESESSVMEMGELNFSNFLRNSTLIHLPDSITLSDSQGNQIELNVEAFERDGIIGIKGVSEDGQNRTEGIYRGEMQTTIEHI